MDYVNAKLLATAVKPEQYPDTFVPEIAFAGRSNVGKSSLINCLTNRAKLARTSSTPGKTAVINFYDINGQYRLVDLPGYGYAKVSKSERDRWSSMIETYLTNRYNLICVIQLVDARHKPSQDDITMINWIKSIGYKPVVIATKIDKIRKSQLEKNLTEIYQALKLDDNSILFPFSSETRSGKEEILEYISEICKNGS